MALAFDLARAAREALSYDNRTRSGSRALISYLMDLLDYGEFRIVEQAAAISQSDNTNLIGFRGPGGPGGLLLSSAVLPSAPVNAARWTETEEDPLSPTERDGLLIGLGAAGNRLDLVCRILAASQVSAERLRRPLIIAGLFGEDARVGGSMHLVDSGICVPDVAVVSDATNLEIVHAHRGYVVLSVGLQTGGTTRAQGRVWRIDMMGEAAHSAEPGIGRNAVVRALRAAAGLILEGASIFDLQGGSSLEIVPESCHFLVQMPDERTPSVDHALISLSEHPPKLCVDGAIESWGRIAPRLAGLLRWSAPIDEDDFLPTGPLSILQRVHVEDGQLRVAIEVRPRPSERVEGLVRDIEAAVRRLGGPDATVEVVRSLLGFQTDPSSPLLRLASETLADLGVPAVVGTHRGHTEAWVYQGVQIDTFVFGPGTLAARHRANEHAVLRHLAVAQEFYVRLIEAICT